MNGSQTQSCDWNEVHAEPTANDELLRNFQQVSMEFSLPTQTSDTLNQLGLFQSAPILSCSRSSLTADSSNQEEEFILDCVFFTGGLVWKIEWLPLQQAEGPQAVEYLVASVHPKGVMRNTIGTQLSGLGMVQIWAVPSSSLSPFGSNCCPVLVGGLVHDGLVTWDMSCCPNLTEFLPLKQCNLPRNDARLGLIALAEGNGKVQILSVPTPGQGQPQNAEMFRPTFHRVRPHLEINFAETRGSLPSSIAWHPWAPHEFLLVGFWDGSAAVVKLLSDPASCNYQILFHIQCDVSAVRTVAWLPCNEPCVDGFERRLFLTAANSGRFKLWDTWDPNAAIFEKLMYRSWITDITWTPNSIVAGLEDGSVRQFILDPNYYVQTMDTGVHVFKGTNSGCVWAVAYHPHLDVIAYCGDDGVIGMTPLRNCTDSRHRRPHAAWGGLRQEGSALRMMDAHHYGTDTGLFTVLANKVAGNKKGEDAGAVQIMPAESQSLHALSFSPNGREVTWLASGGKAGLVRCQRFSARTIHM